MADKNLIDNFTPQQVEYIASLSKRLQSGGFSWQHQDFFELGNIIPILDSLLDNKKFTCKRSLSGAT